MSELGYIKLNIIMKLFWLLLFSIIVLYTAATRVNVTEPIDYKVNKDDVDTVQEDHTEQEENLVVFVAVGTAAVVAACFSVHVIRCVDIPSN